ncbi:MAG: hypothetical protein Q8P05_04820 [Candidatus Diapherotrites archaeon]|nr:hypothetical protein [Candidatus Diapherotrites archaeon]MDZ4256726.1 hypothetical protein [archaeon]
MNEWIRSKKKTFTELLEHHFLDRRSAAANYALRRMGIFGANRRQIMGWIKQMAHATIMMNKVSHNSSEYNIWKDNRRLYERRINELFGSESDNETFKEYFKYFLEHTNIK